MKRIGKLLLAFAYLLSFSAVGQGYISPRLTEKMLNSSELQWITVQMAENVDCQAKIQNFKDRSLSSSQRAKEIIVELQNTAKQSQKPVLDLLSNASKGEVEGYQNFWIVNLIIVKASPEWIKKIAELPEVLTIDLIVGQLEAHEPIILGHQNKTTAPNGVESGLVAINAPAMWQLGYTGRGRVAYNYDTGVWPSHPAFKDRFMANFYPLSQSWYGFFSDKPSGFVNNHGTHTLGTMAGLDPATNDTIGVAFNSYWIANDFVTSTVAALPPLVDMIGAFQWALNPDANINTTHDIPDVINNSWRWYDISDTVHCGGFIVDLMNAIEAAGIANVFSGGNFGPNNTSISSPQRINTSKANTFSVGSVDGNQTFPYPISSFSSKGPTQCPGAGSLAIHPEVVAPGQNVRSAWGVDGYNSISGTSMASPHVSGAILLLKEAFPNLSGDELLMALYTSAVDMGAAGEDNTFGNGMIDVFAAYQLLSLSHTPVDPNQIPWDLEVTDISEPSFNDITCLSYYNPIVTVKNRGDNTIQRIDFTYKVNTFGIPTTHTWNGSLASGQSITILFPLLNFNSFGQQEIILNAEIHNGGAEYDEHNNRRIRRFDRRPSLMLPYFEGFEDGIGPDWLVENEDGAIGWDTLTIGGRGSNTKAAQLALYNYNPRESQKDALISPQFLIPLNGQPTVKFDVSYQRLLTVSQLQDTLRVYGSTNCGLSFDHLLYEKAGADLNTNDTATQNFIPQYESHWRRDSIDLKAFAGVNVVLKFEGVNRKGNNLYLDNIGVFDGIDPLSELEIAVENDWRLFPNPVESRLVLRHNFDENEKVHWVIYNANGQKVLQGQGGAQTQNIDVSILPVGFYVFKGQHGVLIESQTFVKK